MKFATLLLVGLIIYGIFTAHLNVRRSGSEQARTVAVRISAFAWFLGFLFLAALLLLPNKHRVLMLAPLLLGGAVIAKTWKSAQRRVRGQDRDKVDIERMKRVN